MHDIKLTTTCEPTETFAPAAVRPMTETSKSFALAFVAEPAGCPVCGGTSIEKWLTGRDRFELRTQRYDLLHCTACEMVWLDSPPSPEEMGAHYTSHYYQVITAGGEGSAPRWEGHARAVTRYRDRGSLLDLGCSAGAFLSAVQGRNFELYGVEISEPSARQARNRTGAQVFVGDVLHAPFSPESFDVITSFDVLEHLYQPREIMAKVSEWLKPGGIFYVSIPNIRSWEARLFQSYWYGLELPRHLSHFSPESLRHLGTSAGLQVEQMRTPPANYIEYSAHYVIDDLLNGMGISRAPLGPASSASIPWKMVRKALNLTVLPLFAHAAASRGAGPIIEAVFRKDSAKTR